MIHAETLIVIARPRDAVLDYVGNMRRLPEWSRSVREVRDVQPVLPGRSGTAACAGRFLGRRFELSLRFEVLPAPCVVRLETTVGSVPHRWLIELHGSGDKTRVRLVHDISAPAFFGLAAPVFGWLVARVLQADVLMLRDRLEGIRSPHVVPKSDEVEGAFDLT